jgi:hypothetical protein
MPHTDGFTSGIYLSAFYRELEMPHSLMNLQTDIVRQHFTESGENATLTDDFTGGTSPSAFYRVLKNIYWICHYHRRNTSVGIFPAGIVFFWLAFSVCKTIGNIFFYRRS